MALWTAGRGGQAGTSGNTATTAVLTTVTSSATVNTMGSWVTLIASTPFAADTLTVANMSQTFLSGSDTSMLMDIGVGASGSEVVVVAGIPMGGHPAGPRTMPIPLRIASGVRIAARSQSVVASENCFPGLTLSAATGWFPSGGGAVVDSYGVSSSISGGTAIADIGSTNTKGAFTELTSGTTRRCRFLLPLPCLPASNTILAGNYLYDVAIGASGSEQVILPNLGFVMTTTEEMRQPSLQPFPVDLPSGTRLSARQQKSLSTGNPMSLVLLGIS